MKRKVLGILNIIMGILLTLYLLMQNGTIKVIKDANIMHIFMLILAIAIVLLILNIVSFIKRQKEKANYIGELITIIVYAISLIGFLFMGLATIFVPLAIIGGIIILAKN